jgi:ParB family chromosome partitioning protein
MLNSNEGMAFTVLEKALGAKRLKTYGKTDAEIASLMSITTAYVGQLLTLAGAPKKIRDMLQAGEVSATNAIKMMKTHGEGAADVLGKAVKTAKDKGKGKASAKDDEASALLARHKKYGPALFEIIGRYLDTKPNIPEPFSEELDVLFSKVGG